MLPPWTKPQQVAHSGGLWRGMLYTSSREAIFKNYIDGFRIFEIDAVSLADGEIITAHDGAEPQFRVPAGKKFHEVGIKDVSLTHHSGTFTILRLQDLCDVVKQLGIMVILDVKNNHEYVYNQLYQIASDWGVLNQFMPQAYNEQTLLHLRWRNFPYYLMTLWGIGTRSETEKIEFCTKFVPPIVWFRDEWYSQEFVSSLRSAGVTQLGVHARSEYPLTRTRCLEFMALGLHVMNQCVFVSDPNLDEDTYRKRVTMEVDMLYRLYLKRAAEPHGLNEKVERLVLGKCNIMDVRAEICTSDEAMRLRQSRAA